jgi:hypothetical protein
MQQTDCHECGRKSEYTVVHPDTGKIVRVCRFCEVSLAARRGRAPEPASEAAHEHPGTAVCGR